MSSAFVAGQGETTRTYSRDDELALIISLGTLRQRFFFDASFHLYIDIMLTAHMQPSFVFLTIQVLASLQCVNVVLSLGVSSTLPFYFFFFCVASLFLLSYL